MNTQAAGMNGAAVSLLWQRLGESGDAAAREELICHYLPFARMVAATYFGKRFHDEVEFGDYLQLATLGMIEALDRFDPTRGNHFSTFATRRMHGVILDGLERSTEKQQQIALRVRLRQERVESIRPAGSDPKLSKDERSFAEKLLQYLAEVGIGLALSWVLQDTAMIIQDEESLENRQLPYYHAIELEQLKRKIHELVDTLPSQQRIIMRCHYVQEISFARIADMLGLTRGRISQVHKMALDNLRGKLNAKRSCDIAW